MGLFSFNAMAQNQTTGFVANAGQMKATDGTLRSDLLFSTQVQGAKVFLTKTGINYVWYRSAIDTTVEKDSTYRMEVEFKNANANVVVQSSDVQPSYSNYFVGNVSAPNVAEYGKVTYKNLWPNIDLELTSDNSGFNFKYLLAKGANPADIQLVYKGGKKFTAKNGGHVINVPFGESLELSKLSIKKTSISKNGMVATVNSLMSANNTAQITSSNYNANESYVITQSAPNATAPTPIGGGIATNNYWTTYYGGNNQDEVKDVFTTANNTIYVVGNTKSTNFPFSNNATTPIPQGQQDIFVAKFFANRSRDFSTYYGGSGNDNATSIAVNSLGQIYFTGFSDVTTNYPNIANGFAYQSTNQLNGINGVISKLSANGTTKLWSTPFGSTGNDYIYGLSINSLNQVFITGTVLFGTDNLPLKTLTGAYNQAGGYASNSGARGFISRFSAKDSLEWCTYYAAADDVEITSCTHDINNNFFLLGTTSSSGSSGFCGGFQNNGLQLCGPLGAYLQVNNGGGSSDLFISKFSPQGLITWATLYGGSGTENFYNGAHVTNAISTDAAGDVYVTGSTTGSFPGPSSYTNNQNIYGGGAADAFVVRFSNTGARKFATYLGGSGGEIGWAIQPFNEYFYAVTGVTNSTNLLTVQQSGSYYDNTLTGSDDIFYNQYSTNNNSKFLSTYIGGSTYDIAYSLGNAASGSRIILGGYTTSITTTVPEFAFPVKDIPGTIDYFDGLYNGGGDGFIMDLAFSCGDLCKTAYQSEIFENTIFNKSVSAFPNPTNGIFRIPLISTDQVNSIEIINQQGKLILKDTTPLNDSFIDFDLSNYAKGIYLIKINKVSGSEIQKIILQ